MLVNGNPDRHIEFRRAAHVWGCKHRCCRKQQELQLDIWWHMVEDQEDAINDCWVRYFAATDLTVLTDAEGLEYIHDYEE